MQVSWSSSLVSDCFCVHLSSSIPSISVLNVNCYVDKYVCRWIRITLWCHHKPIVFMQISGSAEHQRIVRLIDIKSFWLKFSSRFHGVVVSFLLVYRVRISVFHSKIFRNSLLMAWPGFPFFSLRYPVTIHRIVSVQFYAASIQAVPISWPLIHKYICLKPSDACHCSFLSWFVSMFEPHS